MQLYCPSCQATYAAAPRCPRCGDRLVTPAESFSALAEKAPPPPDIVRTTTGGRIFIGCALALGLYLGLREWGLTVIPAGEWWDGIAGLSVTVVLRAAGAALGGLLAGAGRSPGTATGASVGLICGGLYMLADGVSGSDAIMFDGAVWAGLAVLSATAGAIGSRMWPPPADIPVERGSRGSSLAALAEEEQKKGPRPTAWGRIALALVLAAVAVCAADTTRTLMKKGSAGLLNMGGPAQAPLVDLQLATMGLMLAGVVAGAGTGAGLRHGVIAGLLAGLGVLGLASSGLTVADPVVEGLLWTLDMPTDGSAGGRGLLAVFGSVFGLVALAGWFGGQLLPVLAPKWMQSKLVPMS
jgi:hypothetical protein